jgi:hypothetical protein
MRGMAMCRGRSPRVNPFIAGEVEKERRVAKRRHSLFN